MCTLSWPDQYADLIPSGYCRILEKFDFAPEARVTSQKTFFWLGAGNENALAVWLDLTRHPLKDTCFVLSMSLGEVEDIKNIIRGMELKTGPQPPAMCGGSQGILRFQVEPGYEIIMEWLQDPPESWAECFSLIEKIRNHILTSSDRKAIPMRPLPTFAKDWTFPD